MLSLLSNYVTIEDMSTPNAVPRTARERARAELTAEIVQSARAQLAQTGPADLSLRAVARDLGMASSAVYRYFESRDALLTRLIVDGYTALADSVDAALETAGETGPQKWAAIAGAVRGWAKQNPHEFALLYGTPVPGYQAPADTIDPATRGATRTIRMVAELREASRQTVQVEVPEVLGGQFDNLAEFAGVDRDDQAFVLGTMLWTALFGFIGFELFGTWNNAFEPADELFAAHVDAGSQLLFG